ncbi:MAG: cyclopropane fatty acyl phospholipid synthase [Candidatus Thiodiazotropha sp. (ex Semelilucina semeliformis)]|nr:cyclopropane fatty acyl phospholipid synthase [Candidatus Thiodiazotropha sp. (ex Semelilucina semeliformis)]
MPTVSSRELQPERRRESSPPKALVELMAPADVRFDGDRPWDIQVHDDELYQRVFTSGSLGLGEAYMDGLWDTAQMDVLFYRFMRAGTDERLAGWFKLRLLGEMLRRYLFNQQSVSRAFQVGKQHYDIGNDIFEAMLDSSMSYSCGYWEHAENLEQAQQHKLELICRKLQLKPGEKLLEIGCGWGGLMQHAAENYGVEVVGLTVSKEQQKLAQARCEGLPVKVDLMDYREATGHYDKVVSVGMFEHVGQKNYRVFFETVNRLLSDDGLFLLHTIGSRRTTKALDPWIEKYIFPNGKLPSAREITQALEGCFLIEDWHNFGQDYDRTLMAWWQNFDRAWPKLESRYGRRFYRMWKYYLHTCAGFFRSRQGHLWQLVLTKRSHPGTYRSIRTVI